MTLLLEQSQDRDWYTDGDLITGKVFLEPTKHLGVRSITVMLRCKEIVSVTWVERRRSLSGSRIALLERDKKKFYHVNQKKKVFSFGKAELKGSDTGKLSEGPHEFPFTFKMPDLKSCPPPWTKESDNAKIMWYIKARVERPGIHRDKIRYFHIKVFPKSLKPERGSWFKHSETCSVPRSKLGVCKKSDSEPQAGGSALLSLAFPESGIVQSLTPEICINAETTHPELIMVRLVEARLHIYTGSNIRGHGERNHSTQNIGHLENINFNADGILDISGLMEKYESWNFPLMPEAFRANWFQISYSLDIRMKLMEKLKQKILQEVVISAPCRLLSPALVDKRGMMI